MNRKFPPCFVIVGLLLSAAVGPCLGEDKRIFIDNGIIRLGVDLESGGGIFSFSRVSPERNVLNHGDKGRLIQQSYYGDSDGTAWAGKPWRWNPVQGGSFKNVPATVLATEAGLRSLFVRTRPRHWASGEDMPDVLMEENLELEGDVARLRFKFQYLGKKTFSPQHQELPAVFADYRLSHLVFYAGSHPWTGGELKKITPGFPNEYEKTSESWVAGE